MCVGFADCPCTGCRATRVAATAAHPDHAHVSDRSYCGACRTAERERNVPRQSPDVYAKHERDDCPEPAEWAILRIREVTP